MRTSIWTAVLLGVCASACTNTSHTSTSTTSATSSAAPTDEIQILSQDECDLRAGNSITATNCDSEFDKLVREIEADQNDGG